MLLQTNASCKQAFTTALFALQVADLIGADPKEIIFTSGATESNNLAIKGVANFYREKKKHIITTQTDRELLTFPRDKEIRSCLKI